MLVFSTISSKSHVSRAPSFPIFQTGKGDELRSGQTGSQFFFSFRKAPEKNWKISLSFGSFLFHTDFLLLECSLRSGDDESNLTIFCVGLTPPTLMSLSTHEI